MNPHPHTRCSARAAKTLAAWLVLATCLIVPLSAEEPVSIGSGPELFVDDHLIGELTGDAKRRLHKPTPGEVALVTDEPWEGNTCAYYTVFQDGGLYDYHRQGRAGKRDIMTCTSPDFLKWTEPVFLEYPGAPEEHLYTNAVQPYYRAPHLFIAFPTRYHPERGSQVEPTLMSSRDGLKFHRWTEALIPVTAPEDRDGNRSNYMAWGMINLRGNDRELSVYATEAYYTGPDSRLRRFTYRVDGFVSVHAPASGGELVTKPLIFEGRELVVNFATAASGGIRVEIRDAGGNPIPGFTLVESKEINGDEIEQVLAWKDGPNTAALAGEPVRLRFVIKNGDLYSLRFR